MMLAAKLSWLLRSFRRRHPGRGVNAPEWTGEPKDLFDVYLLLMQADLRADTFRQSLAAVGNEDRLHWNNLQALFDVRSVQRTDADFPNWREFHQRHTALLTSTPVGMLETIADRLEPLLGDFYLREEMPFLLAVNADPVDESIYLIYADWLEEHGQPRGQFLRLFTRFFFHAADLSRAERARTRGDLQAALDATSIPWLLQLFGTSARLGELRRHVEDESS